MRHLWMYEEAMARSAGQEPMVRLRVRCSALGGLRVIGVDITPDPPRQPPPKFASGAA